MPEDDAPTPDETPAAEPAPEPAPDVEATPPQEGDAAARAARLAGWDPADGPAPYEHAEPPADDPALGHNGIPPTGADQVA
jgi:hypothetical protein